MKTRVPFQLVNELIKGEKTASETKSVTEKDLFELGLVEKEVTKIAACAAYNGQKMAEAFFQKVAELQSAVPTTDPSLQGKTPLQEEQPSDGGAVTTDHAGKHPVPNPAVIAEVKKLLQAPQIQHSSGEGTGVAAESAGVDDKEVSTAGTNGMIGKSASENDSVLNSLLNLA